MSTSNKGIIIVIYSYAKGNFYRIKQITSFLNKYHLYAATKGEIDDTKPPIVIEINLLEDDQEFIIDDLKKFIKESGMESVVKFTINDTEVSFSDMAKSLGSALFKTGLSAINNRFKAGSVMATPEEKNRRLEICRGCDYFNHRTFRCTRCKCRLQYKAGIASTNCPIGKW
jgi:hypothetical protein